VPEVFDQVMKTCANLMLLVVLAVVLPGGSLLLALAYAKYRRATARAQAGCSGEDQSLTDAVIPDDGQARLGPE
jgi:uncharacterized protein GlcG (DUF336 family)